MVLLMYSPSVYNQSCYWFNSHPAVDGKPALGGGSGSNGSLLLLAPGTSATPGSDWTSGLAAGTSFLSGYDLFRCVVVLTVTCGLISGNLILALAVNCKYSAGILQFQVRLPSYISYPGLIPLSLFFSLEIKGTFFFLFLPLSVSNRPFRNPS